MSHHVEEGLVAAELEVFARRVRPQRLIGLAVGVAPEMHERCILRYDPHRVRSAEDVSALIEHAENDICGFLYVQPLHHCGEGTWRIDRTVSGKPAIADVAL